MKPRRRHRYVPKAGQPKDWLLEECVHCGLQRRKLGLLDKAMRHVRTVFFYFGEFGWSEYSPSCKERP